MKLPRLVHHGITGSRFRDKGAYLSSLPSVPSPFIVLQAVIIRVISFSKKLKFLLFNAGCKLY